MDYIGYITSNHSLYDRYYEDWQLNINSWYGGTEYKEGRYLRAYQIDFNTPNETVNTYQTNSDGSVVGKYKATLASSISADANNRGADVMEGSFYAEKLGNTPLYNYVKLIVAEYNSILFRNPPQRILPEVSETERFRQDVDGEGNSINEFLSQVDMMASIYGVVHVGCYKPTGSDLPKWRIHSPLDVTNWKYTYDREGNLKLDSMVIKIEETDEYTIYRHMTPNTIETIFVGAEEDEEFTPPVSDADMVQVDTHVYKIVQENELGYIPVKTIYQSTKVYNNIGTTIISDVAQIQRSVYGDMAEIYSAITFSAHPTLLIDDVTESLNDGQIGSEPGGIVRVQSSVTGEQSYTYEFISPKLDAITEIRELVDSKINKLTQIAMIRSEDIIKSSRSGEQIEVYDDKLASLIRRKATNLENAEAKLWKIWADWLNIQLPEDFAISYSRQYNKKAVEHEIAELSSIMSAFERYTQLFESESEESESDTQEYPTVAEAQAEAARLGGTGFHEYVEEDGSVVYMPFNSHSEYLNALNMNMPASMGDDGFQEDMRDRIRNRLMELLDSTSTNNGL